MGKPIPNTVRRKTGFVGSFDTGHRQYPYP
jgi:hypothetical protein